MTLVSLLDRDDIPEDVKGEIQLEIDNQRKTKVYLLKTEKRLQYLLKSSPAIIYSCEPCGNFPTVFISENVKEKTGYNVQEFINDSSFWINGIHPNDRQRSVANFEDIVQKEHYKEIYRFKHKSGSYLWMLDEATLIRDNQGRPIEIVGYWTDITKQKEAEERLKQSEEQFRSLVTNIPAVAWISDRKGNTIYVSPNIERVYGFTQEEIYQSGDQLWFGRIHPDDVERVKESYRLLFATGSSFDEEYRIQKKNNQWIWLHDNAFSVFEKNGTQLVYGVFSDITERKKVEEKLRASEERYRMLFNESPVSLWELDCSKAKHYIDSLISTGIIDLRKYFEIHPEEVKKMMKLVKILDINSATLKLYKATRKIDLLQDLSVVFREKSFLAFREMIIAFVEGQCAFEIEGINNTLSGEEINVLLRLNTVPGFETTLSRVIISILDITYRVEMEKALRESEERLRAFMDSATDSFLLLDSELNIIEVNQNLEDTWHLNKHKLIGRNISDLRDRVKFDSPDEYIERFTQLFDVIKTESLYDEEFTVFHPLHGTRYISVRAFKVGSGLGIISRDITQQKQADLVRKELEQRRENFIYMASHELRTPLTVISGYCDFLDNHDQFIDHDRRDRIISVMKSNIHRLERLTEDVAQVTQIEKEQFQVSKKEFDLCDFLYENLDQYNQLLGIQFRFRMCKTQHIIMIKADPDRLRQVLENVISNAIKHTSKDKRKITVKVEEQGSDVAIYISDNGAGIASEHLESIFEQFVSFQTEYAAGGTGIGLYLSRKILEAHGGRISAKSEGLGLGTTFIIELPRIIS